jgi:circadian clock protein KaiC
LSTKETKRVPTGIPGLDPLIQGGLRQGDIILLIGGIGTGKTIFSTHFVYNSAKVLGEPAVFATFEEDIKGLKRNMARFGMNLDELESKKMLKMLDLDAVEARGMSSNIQVILDALDELKAKKLVVDSLTAFLGGSAEKFDYTFMMHLIYKTLKREGITTLMTVSKQSRPSQIGGGIEEFVADGIFYLESYLTQQMEMRTRFIVKKLRGVDHDRKYHNLAFTPEGVSILAFST